MSTPREELINYCLRKLGAPVVQVNITPDQMEDCVDDALQMFNKYHYNGTERKWLGFVISAEDITNKYIKMPSLVDSVVRVLPFNANQGSDVQFSNLWQYRYDILNPIAFGGDGSLVHYELAMQNLNLIDDMFANRPPVGFTSNQKRLYLAMDWNQFVAGQTEIIVECHLKIDPNEFPNVYDESFMKKYTTALMKKQWGMNLKKFQNVQLPGGIMLDGKTMFDEAVEELKELSDDLKANEQVLGFFVG